jgi:hypothetical protein
VLANISQLCKCCVWWLSVALVVVSNAGWRKENLCSVLSGIILFLDSNQLSVEWLLGLKQLVFEDAWSFTSFAPYIVDCVVSVDHCNKFILTYNALYFILFFVLTALLGASVCKNDFL